ncbi:MAG: hypothetical protein E6K82_07375 [Candidatus Rokuibacteriota bacterium]|nr:MAG: hypothetical protein E6K82_07375 [Candidatus Rokubacteria bacterium]
MVTANIDEALVLGTLRDGAFDYVTKPVPLGRLREVLAAALRAVGEGAAGVGGSLRHF